jgi:hypothetical protein
MAMRSPKLPGIIFLQSNYVRHDAETKTVARNDLGLLCLDQLGNVFRDIVRKYLLFVCAMQDLRINKEAIEEKGSTSD